MIQRSCPGSLSGGDTCHTTSYSPIPALWLEISREKEKLITRLFQFTDTGGKTIKGPASEADARRFDSSTPQCSGS